MSHDRKLSVTRRSFLQGATALGGGVFLAGAAHTAHAAAAPAADALPRRLLGRTQLEVSCLTLGTWPCGKCDTIDDQAVARLVAEAIDLGINHIDSARAYDNAEAGIGKALGKRRNQVVLTTKVWADTADEAQQSFEQSLRELRTDHVDILYLHSAGDRDLAKVTAPGGALEYLLRQKEAGKTRFLGISGHCIPHKFVTLIETGKIDVILMAMNYVDRHTYGFEDKVLPAANAHNMGVCCMKVFGGMRGGFGVADDANPGPEMPLDRLQQAIDYSLSLPGVATAVIGVHTSEQLRHNVAMVKRHRPLSAAAQQELAEAGRETAKQWGPHFGPVA